MVRTQFTRIKLTEQNEKSVPLLTQLRSYSIRKATCHHVQQSPPHSTQLLPSDLMLPLLNQLCRVFVHLIHRLLFPEGSHLRT